MRLPAHLSSARTGFSLVELAIVLVIIGLLVGGILSGKSLIRTAELRSVITDANAYITATNNFRSQYRYLPGDMPTAENYWGAAATDNGNGDGVVSGDERFRFWEHLNSAGFVEKKLSGATGGGGTDDFVIGTNVPASRVGLAGFSFFYQTANMSDSTLFYIAYYLNLLAFGQTSGVNSGAPLNAALSPGDAFDIDRKADDGISGTGKWIANGNGTVNFGVANSCTTSASGTDYAGTYRLSVREAKCSFLILSGY